MIKTKKFCKFCKRDLIDKKLDYHKTCLDSMKQYFEEHKFGMFLNTYHGRFFLNAMVSDIIRYGENSFRDDNKNIVPFLDYCKKNEVFKIGKDGIMMNFLNYPSSIGAEELIPVEEDEE